MQSWHFLLTLDCGHKIHRESASKYPKPKVGQHTECMQCRQVATITAVSFGGLQVSGWQFTIEKTG